MNNIKEKDIPQEYLNSQLFIIWLRWKFNEIIFTH